LRDAAVRTNIARRWAPAASSRRRSASRAEHFFDLERSPARTIEPMRDLRQAIAEAEGAIRLPALIRIAPGGADCETLEDILRGEALPGVTAAVKIARQREQDWLGEATESKQMLVMRLCCPQCDALLTEGPGSTDAHEGDVHQEGRCG
jgi:hypothetical protein